jgi:hypothetical protein
MRRLVVAALALATSLPAACSDGDPGLVRRAALRPATTATTGRTVAPSTTTTTLSAPAQLALQLRTAEAGIRDPSTTAADVAALGQSQQRAYMTLVAHPEWDAEVLAAVPEALRPPVEANLGAGRDLFALHGPVPDDAPLPKWRIVPPPPADELLALYRAAGTAAGGVPWYYLAAVHLIETRLSRIKGDSSAGAQGPMQFIPSTWAVYGRGGDIQSTTDSVYAAARFLRAAGAPSNMARALFSYNNSNRYVGAVTAYAEQMRADERAFLGYHAWQVYYGARLLPEGTVVG